MFHKFLNVISGEQYVITELGRKHYEDNSGVVYLGSCDEEGVLHSNVPIPIRSLDKHTKKLVKNIIIKPKKGEEEAGDSFDYDDEA